MSLADSVLIVHAMFVAGVVLPVPLIVIGKLRGWKWVHSLPLRLMHLGMIGFVIAESLLGVMCPLTVWENDLRMARGDTGYGDSFIAYWLKELLFWHFPSWVFTVIYAAFGSVVIALWWWVRPSRSQSSPKRN